MKTAGAINGTSNSLVHRHKQVVRHLSSNNQEQKIAGTKWSLKKNQAIKIHDKDSKGGR